VAAPTVTRISPASGSQKGGTRVTVRGINFVGVISVHFGGRVGTAVHVFSPSELRVTAPSGSGTVYVTVAALGGSSRVVATGKYRY
jgi:hypothetical protein